MGAVGAPVVRAYVNLPEGQVHCHMRGDVRAGQADEDAVPIVFLHQTASSAACYDPVLNVLDLPNPLVAFDTPGFGGSFDPDGEPDMADYAGWIARAAHALGIKRFHLFGHHTGASLALELAARLPDQVQSVMLAGPVFMTPAERDDFLRHYRDPIRPRADGGHLLDNWNYAAAFNAECPPELMHGEVVAMLRAWRGRGQAYAAVARHDAFAAAAQVRCPVLLLTSPDDFFHATLDRAQAALPGAELAVTGGGNFQPTADPRGVARAVAGFLGSGRKVDQPSA